jgi:hypothetical protein
MDKRTSMGVIGNLNAYTQFQAANAMEAAAKNPDGMASGGMGMGMGFAMAQQMGQAMMGGQQQAQGAGTATPPPVPGAAAWFVAVNGQQAGPFDQSMLASKISSGEISRDTLIWKNGMSGWVAAGTVAEVAGLFGQTPPPLPPQG